MAFLTVQTTIFNIDEISTVETMSYVFGNDDECFNIKITLKSNKEFIIEMNNEEEMEFEFDRICEVLGTTRKYFP